MIARKSLLIVLNNLVGGGFGVLAYFFIGRYMSPQALGAWGFAMGLMGFFSILGSLGFDQAHIKRLSEGQDVARSLGTYTVIKIGLAAAFALVGFGAAYLWHVTKGFQDTTIQVILAVTVYYTLILLRHVPLHTFMALRLTVRAETLSLVENVVRLPLIVGVALLFAFWTRGDAPALGRWLAQVVPTPGDVGPAAGALYLAVAAGAAMLASLAVGLWLLRRHHFSFGAFDRGLARRYAAFALPIALVSLFQVFVTEMDKVMVGFFGESADVGFYVTAQRYAGIVYLVPVATVSLVFPVLSQMAGTQGAGAVSRYAGRAQRYVSMAVLWTALIPVAFPAQMLNILVGGAFVPAAPVLRVLTIWAVLASFTMISAAIVEGLDRPLLTARITAVAIAANLVLNTLLIPRSIQGVPLAGLGPTGAALGTVGAQLISLVFLAGITRRLTGRTHIGWHVVRHALAAGLTLGLLWWIAPIALGDVDRWYELGAAGGLATLVYALLLVAMRELTRDDLSLFAELVHPGKMAGYVRDELTAGPKQPPMAP